MKFILLALGAFNAFSLFSQVQTTTSKDCYLLYNYNGKEFNGNKKIKAGTLITVYNEFIPIPLFYEVECKGLKGCLKIDYITINDDITVMLNDNSIKERREQIADSINNSKFEIIRKKQEQEREMEYQKWERYIKQKQVIVGMPEKYIRNCLGSPNKVDIIETSLGTTKYFKYDHKVITVFKNKVEAIYSF